MIYIYINKYGHPPTRAYLELFLIVFAVKKTIVYCSVQLCVIYILPFLWVFGSLRSIKIN